MGRPAVIYTRISSDREGAGLGVERQRADCQELAERLGWDVVATYADNDLSAYSGKPRPGYRALLDDLRTGRATSVIAWHTDRLHRSTVELEDYVAISETHDVVTQTVKAGPLDLSTPSGRLVARQLGAVARYEVEHAVERMKRARVQAVAAGKWSGGRRPFGYAADGVTIVDAEAAELRRAADAVLAGASMHSLARDLNARGMRTSTGGTWTNAELRRVLMRPRNAGLIQHNGKAAGRAEWPAIITEDVWRGVCAVLSDPKRRTSPGGALRHLGSGLYKCGVCGETMFASPGNGKPGYRCRSRQHVQRDLVALDTYVVGYVLRVLSKPENRHVWTPRTPDVGHLHTEAAGLREQLDEAASLYAEGVLDATQLRATSTRLRTRLDDLERRIGSTIADNALGGLVGSIEDAEARWETLTFDQRRTVLSLVVEVVVHPGRRGRQAGGVYFDASSIEFRHPWAADAA